MWTQAEQPLPPPDLPANLRDKFFQVAATVLLRALPAPDQDSKKRQP